MRNLIGVVLTAALCASPAVAQDKKATEEQQKRSADCSKQAADKRLQGRERSQFVTNCMRGDTASPQQAKQK